MSLFFWFMIIVLGAIVVAMIALVVAFIRLGSEIRKLDANTQTLQARMSQSLQSGQFIATSIATARQAVLWIKNRQSNMNKRGKHGEKDQS